MSRSKVKSERSSRLSNWQGRASLDPVETYQTAANVEGVFLRRLFTFRLRTRNIISLITMFVFGVAATVFMGFAFYASIEPVSWQSEGMPFIGLAIIYSLFGFVMLVGITLLINFSINIAIILGFIRSPGSNNRRERDRNERKKKLPKRRKDFK